MSRSRDENVLQYLESLNENKDSEPVLFHGTTIENSREIDTTASFQPRPARPWHSEHIARSEKPMVFASSDPKVALIHAIGKSKKDKAYLRTKSGDYLIYSYDFDQTIDRVVGAVYCLESDMFVRTTYPEKGKETKDGRTYASSRQHSEWISEHEIFASPDKKTDIYFSDIDRLIESGITVLFETEQYRGQRSKTIADKVISADSRDAVIKELTETGMCTLYNSRSTGIERSIEALPTEIREEARSLGQQISAEPTENLTNQSQQGQQGQQKKSAPTGSDNLHLH